MKYIAIEQNNTKQSLLRVKNQDSKNKNNHTLRIITILFI